MPSAEDNFEVTTLPVLEIKEMGYLLIPSRFPPVPIYARIANGNDERFAEIESRTNPRLQEKNRLLANSGAVVDEHSPRLQNWNHAPFTYRNPEGSWFFDATINCLELSRDMQTALAVSVSKRETFLGRTMQGPIGLDMRMLGREVKGRFLDARGLPANMSRDQRREVGQKLLRRCQDETIDGVLFHSPERARGTRMVVLEPEAVPNRATQMQHYRYSWDGCKIASLYAFNSQRSDAENKLDPDDLRGDREIDVA